MARILVLCVDRDDDLGKKTGIKGPVKGAEENLKAAAALLQADPSESDGNAIFEAVKTFKELKKDAVDVVTITGHPSRGYKADKTLSAQLDSVLKEHRKIDGVYLVTDGADDDQVIPIIHSRTRIISKKTLIIKQAKELEKSYYVVKQLLQEPAFARIIFGLPGIILLTVAFFQELGLKIIILLIGLYLLMKGFGIEEPLINTFRNFRESVSIERATFPVYLGSFIILLLSIWAGAEKMITSGSNVIMQATSFLAGFSTLFVIAMLLFFMGRAGDMIYKKETHRIKKYLMSVVSMIAIWIILVKMIDFSFGRIAMDEFMLWVVFAFFACIAGFGVVKRLYIDKFIATRLKKELEVYNENGVRIGTITEVNSKKRMIGMENEDKQKEKIPFTKIAIVTDSFISVRTH